MPVPTVINLNDQLPAATSGRVNAQWQGDANNPRNVSANLPNHGRVSARTTTSETITQADQGKLLTFTNASPIAVTINNPTDATFMCYVAILGGGLAQFSPSSGTINGNASLVLAGTYDGILFWDGTNWRMLQIPPVTGGGGGAPANDEYIIGAQDYANLPNSVAIPGLYQGPDVQPASPGSIDDEFNGSALSGAWTWVSQGGATANIAGSRLGLTGPAHSGQQYRYIYQTAPATPWRVNLQAQAFGMAQIWNCGLLVSDGTKLIVAGFSGTTSNIGSVGTQLWNSPTSFNSSVGTSFWNPGAAFFLGVEDDGTNLTFFASPDGINYLQLYQAARGAFLSTGPTRVGIGVDQEFNGGELLLTSDWFRRVL